MTREQLNHFLKGQKKIEAADLVYVLEEKLGYTVSLEKKSALTKKQRDFATKKIFSEPDILEQLKHAKGSRNPEFSHYSDDADKFSELVDKINAKN